jgi:hypothetical protein
MLQLTGLYRGARMRSAAIVAVTKTRVIQISTNKGCARSAVRKKRKPMVNREDCGLFFKTATALATVRACKFCKHVEIVRRSVAGRNNPLGRGYGLSAGNKARGRMIQHVKTEHPAEYAAFMAANRKPLKP